MITILADDVNVAHFENMPDNQVLTYILADLQTLFPKVSIPQPIYYRAQRWTSNPNYLGAWSYNAVGINPVVDFTNIRKSSSPRLVFAGEHTDRYHFATVWGAYNSGQRSATSIAKVLRL